MTIGLPFILAIVAQTTPASAGLRYDPTQPHQAGANTLLTILVLGAAFMGMSAGVRELTGERPIYRREWAVGLRPSAYLGAKVVFCGLECAAQATVLGLAGLLGRELPDSGLVLAEPRQELLVVLACTAFASAG